MRMMLVKPALRSQKCWMKRWFDNDDDGDGYKKNGNNIIRMLSLMKMMFDNGAVLI